MPRTSWVRRRRSDGRAWGLPSDGGMTMSSAAAAPTVTGNPSVTVVLPIHRDGDDLRACLAALTALDPPPDEVVIAVDGADPALVELARDHADEVVPVLPQSGPAVARNLAACHARSDVLWFVDADVEVHADGVARIREILADEDVTGVIGSYDDVPPAPSTAARYKNLLNHHVHHHAGAEAETFWGACGAVRRQAFLAVGGFDGATYAHPSIEDIELGYRLVDAGYRLRLDPTLQVTHRKAWTVRQLVETDVLRRALPWGELLLQRGGLQDDLNTDVAGRAKVAATGLATALLALPTRRGLPARAAAAAALVAAVAVLDAPLLRTFARAPVGGRRFAVAAWALHLLSYLYSGATFGVALLRHATGQSNVPRGDRPPLTPIHPEEPS